MEFIRRKPIIGACCLFIALSAIPLGFVSYADGAEDEDDSCNPVELTWCAIQHAWCVFNCEFFSDEWDCMGACLDKHDACIDDCGGW